MRIDIDKIKLLSNEERWVNFQIVLKDQEKIRQKVEDNRGLDLIKHKYYDYINK